MVHESYYSTGEERERKKKRAKRNETTTTEREGGGGGGARGVQKKKRARERERERKTSHRIDISNGISRFHKMYLVICPVVSNLFSLRSTYMAAVLYIPDPLLSRAARERRTEER